MKDSLHKILKPIKEVQLIRGIELPVGLEFRQLVVTGPPGAGKSYYIEQIRGWPNEGFLDLSRKGWWRDRSLVYRPREIHLGIPYIGHKDSLTVFDQEWLDCSPHTLVRRFKEVRRNHPLQVQQSMLEAIEDERQRLEPIRAIATRIIDTSNTDAADLREALIRTLVSEEKASVVSIDFTSFGFKYGIPRDVDFVFDARFLPNPFYVPELRHLTGENEQVYDYVMNGTLAAQ